MFEPETPKIVSIYSDLQIMNKFLKFLVLILLVALFISFRSAQKPPIVIREGQLGVSVAENYESESAISNYDVQLFIDHFVHNLNLLDSFSLQENLPKGLNMMDTNLRGIYKTQIVTPDLVKKVLSAKTKTKTTIRESKFDIQKEQIPATAIVEREVINYESGIEKKIIFRAEMILKIVPRSVQNPYGLLVMQYKEIELN